MTQWEAALVVLYSAPGRVLHYLDITKGIIAASLCMFRTDTPEKSVRVAMTNRCPHKGLFQRMGNGTYAIGDAAKAESVLRALGVKVPDQAVTAEAFAEERPASIEGSNNAAPESSTPLQGGAGFGDSAENKIVERAAIRTVKEKYEEDGWTVSSVEHDKCGFDLDCKRNQEVENAEVKGVRGTEQRFFITAGEVEQARKNPKFVLWVVTSALSSSPIPTRYSGAEFCQRFALSPVQYRAVVR